MAPVVWRITGMNQCIECTQETCNPWRVEPCDRLPRWYPVDRRIIAIADLAFGVGRGQYPTA